MRLATIKYNHAEIAGIVTSKGVLPIAALNKGLEAVKCNVLVASHDHQLIQTVCNRVFDFTPEGKLIDSKTTYDEYLERQREQEAG